MGYEIKGIPVLGCEEEYGLDEAECLDSGYTWGWLYPAYGIYSTKNNLTIKNIKNIYNFSLGIDGSTSKSTIKISH